MNKTANKHESIINIIAYSIENDEKGIKNLLKRNGVNADLIKTKRGLTKAFIDALSKSKVLAVDFNKYIEIKKRQPNTASMDGKFHFGNSNISDFNLDSNIGNVGLTNKNIASPLDSSFPKTDAFTTTDASKPKTAGSGFFSGLNLKDLLNAGVGILEIQRDLRVSKDNKSAVEQAVQVKRDEINLQPKSKSSSGKYIALGVLGLTIIGGIFWVILKKK